VDTARGPLPVGPQAADFRHQEYSLRASRRLIWMIASVHLLAAGMVLGVFGTAGRGAWLVALPVIALLRAMRVELQRGRSKMNLCPDGRVSIEGPGGVVWSSLVSGHVDLGWAVWVHGSTPRPTSRNPFGPSLMLLQDHFVRRSDWRLLRVWLRHGPGATISSGDA